FEVRELPGRSQRFGIDDVGWHDFGVAALAVFVEHEINEGAIQPRAGAGISANRAPAIFAARSKSRMPRASPRSQCGFGLKSKPGFSPHVRSTRLALSSRPSGTLSCGTFGR